MPEMVEALLEGSKKIDPEFRQVLIRLKVANANSAEEKLKILADEHLEETGASPAQAFAHVLSQRPELAAPMELQRARRASQKKKGTK